MMIEFHHFLSSELRIWHITLVTTSGRYFQ